jgi:hypothetical protein
MRFIFITLVDGVGAEYCVHEWVLGMKFGQV